MDDKVSAEEIRQKMGSFDAYQVSLALCCTLFHSYIYGYEFSPPVRYFETEGPLSYQTFNVSNKGGSDFLAVELTIHERIQNGDGSMSKGAVTEEDFLVYPSQIILSPGEEQIVRVGWAGLKNIKTEKIYVIACSQKKMDIPKEILEEKRIEQNKSQFLNVNLLFNYENVLYVLPKGAKSNVTLTSVNLLKDHNQEARLSVSLNNNGQLHQSLSEYSLLLRPIGGV